MRPQEVILFLRLAVTGRSFLLQMFLDPLVSVDVLLERWPNRAPMVHVRVPFGVLQKVERFVGGVGDAHPWQQGGSLIWFQRMDQFGTDEHDQFGLTPALGLRSEQDSDNRDVADERDAFAFPLLIVLDQTSDGEPLPFPQIHRLLL